MKYPLLIVEDCEDIQRQLAWGVGGDYTLLNAATAGEALFLYRKHAPRVVLLDLGLPPEPAGTGEGLRCLEEMLRIRPSAKIIVLTGHGERKVARSAIQAGAYDYLLKPMELGDLRVILKRAFHLSGLEEESRRLQSGEGAFGAPGGLLGRCEKMQEVFRIIHKVSSCDVPVLILGESGTGKELVARAIHQRSRRDGGPFVPINCGAIPENLLESEFFGHERGAFTGAQVRRPGKVEYAGGGTLFLDEIGDLPLALQVKLLRFLQEKIIQRVGGREDIAVDARIVAATNVDIDQAIRRGAFREDLYYRIGVLTIVLPPLRERGEDMLLLADLFLRRFSEEIGKKILGFTPSALERITSYPWPGNIRELENKIKRGVILCESPYVSAGELGLGTEERAPSHRPVSGRLTLKEARDRLESQMLFSEIERQSGNIAKAAEALGVSRPTIYDLMKKHGFSNNPPS